MMVSTEIFEKFVFTSNRKESETLRCVLLIIFSLPLAEIKIGYENRPDESFSRINDRAKKILLNPSQLDKVKQMTGLFVDGGVFEFRGGNFSITIPSDRYNFELVDAMKRFLSPVFPICIIKNPYIWGVDLFEVYERESLFETRVFTARSQHLEEPEIDIFRRDNGIIFKLRFHLNVTFDEIDEGFRFLRPICESLLESLHKKVYEGIEVLHLYCTEPSKFRNLEPRTKLGREIKRILYNPR